MWLCRFPSRENQIIEVARGREKLTIKMPNSTVLIGLLFCFSLWKGQSYKQNSPNRNPKTALFNKKGDPDSGPGPNPDTAFYWHPNGD